MGTIALFDHTADVGLSIEAADLDDLFRTAAQGVFGYVVENLADVRSHLSETVSLEAETAADLLLAWLSDLVFRSETQHCIYSRFDVHVTETAAGARLQGTIGGEPIDPDRHILDHEVKAVTRHGLTLRREGERWLAEVILDI